ncbi:MAG: hypothetical protein B7Y56_05590 [Gallionellales bacterium 35-53-114]|nr:MAG: hypothetical protein B7Y56_05590 [Gallionellales bacterium 35-53-114]OYZ63681.1 MAG: hypothetical protein B7Y04_06700 [Gallionellales bacterium 24-53-125]OZB09486.1 MAG: hypothetical protein B7X61_07515 [Gallionellales bacterium 39-52-133]
MPERTPSVGEAGTLGQVDSTDLLGSREALMIRHQGECYILRKTRAGKLILTK